MKKSLKAENAALRARYNDILARVDESEAVMADIMQRDNNFYRVMLQADPMTVAQRYAGLERQRRDSGLLADDEPGAVGGAKGRCAGASHLRPVKVV